MFRSSSSLRRRPTLSPTSSAERLPGREPLVRRRLEPLARERRGDQIAPRQDQQILQHVQRLGEHAPSLRCEVADGDAGEDVADEPDRRVRRVEVVPGHRAVEEHGRFEERDRRDAGEPADQRTGGQRREHDGDVEELPEPEARPAVREDEREHRGVADERGRREAAGHRDASDLRQKRRRHRSHIGETRGHSANRHPMVSPGAAATLGVRTAQGRPVRWLLVPPSAV